MREQDAAALEVQAIARQLGVDRPIVAWRCSDEAIELVLLGGQTITVRRVRPAGPEDDLERLTLARLRRLAHERGLRRTGRLTRDELLQALR